MKSLFRSFYGRLSIVYLVILLILGIIQVSLSVKSALDFTRESDQLLHKNLAADIAVDLKPFLGDSIDFPGVEHMMHYLMVMNPRVEIYLLSEDGTIKSFFAEPKKKIKRERVDLAPVRTLLENDGELPILGDDPRHESRLKPFSAARVEIAPGTQGYVYVVLGSELSDTAAQAYRERFLVRTTTTTIVVALAFAAIIGLILFGVLTRRLNRMTNVVRRFEHGDLEERVKDPGSDEIGELARAFNNMADTLADNLTTLKNTDKLRRELIANVSHDLRSPLASMQGYLETVLMKQSSLDADALRKYLDIIHENTQNLNRLVDELFELSKLEAQQIKPEEEPFSVAELTQDVAVKFQPKADRNKVKLQTTLPKDLPLVIADIGLIERALSNLIDNAISYTPSGGEVTVRILRQDGGIRIVVSDTGDGIPQDELPLVFERFYRVEKSRTRRAGGSGLGLAIAKKIVELHKGTLSITSKLNVGTTLSFDLKTAESRALPT